MNYAAVQFRIARPTNKLEEVINFYTKGLNLKIIYSFAGHDGYKGVMIGLPGAQYHLEYTEDEKVRDCKAPTKDNLMVLYFQNIESLNFIKNSLESLGHQALVPENPYWKDKGWTYEDPEGWRVVLCNGVFNSPTSSGDSPI